MDNPLFDTEPVLITGAPRSGASIIAEAFIANGVFLGSRFGNASNHSMHSHLCDRDVAGLHQDSLAARNQSFSDLPSLTRSYPADGGFQQKAAELLADWYTQGPWGWKDPGGLLFLDEWSRLLPNAHFLFAVRRPAEIAWAAAGGGWHRNTTRRSVARRSLNAPG